MSDYPVSNENIVLFKSVTNLNTDPPKLWYVFDWWLKIPTFNVLLFPPAGVLLPHIFFKIGTSLNGIDL